MYADETTKKMENILEKLWKFCALCRHTNLEIFGIIITVSETNGGEKMSRPYRKGDRWYIKLASGYEMEFESYEAAWSYYDEHT